MTTPTKQTGQIIWDTMVGLREANQAISRARLMEVTGMKYTLIDDHVSRWIEEGRLRRVVDGVYEIVDPVPEPRAVSVTYLHDGLTLIECGDQEMRLQEAEMRALGRLTVGNAMQFAQLQTQADMGAILAEVTVQKRALADRVSDLERQVKELTAIKDLKATLDRQRLAKAAGQGELIQ